MLLAIETSCDETAVAILDTKKYLEDYSLDKSLVAHCLSTQVKLHQPYGGVVPEVAARDHINSLPKIFNMCLQQSGLSSSDITSVAVTRGPGLNGCLLVGINFAKAFAYSKSLPLYGINHLEGHIHASRLCPSNGRSSNAQLELPALVLLVSGGHTLLALWTEDHCYKIIANTRDDAAGEAFDKIATAIGLNYPGGPELSNLAIGGKQNSFVFPIGMQDDASAFSFSGFKTAAIRALENNPDILTNEELRKNFAAAIESAIVDNLIYKTQTALKNHTVNSLVITGGVAANRVLQQKFGNLAAAFSIPLVIPPKEFCTDNAAMIAAVAASLIKTAVKNSVGISNYNFAPKPRWALQELYS